MTDYGIDDNQQELIDKIVYMVQSCQSGERDLYPILGNAIVEHCLTLLVINGRLKPFVEAIRDVATRESIQEWSTTSALMSDTKWGKVADGLKELIENKTLDPSS